MTRKNPEFYLELSARIYVFVMLNIYGWGKLLGGQFYRKGHLSTEVAQKTLEQLSGFELAWTFMGYSYAYILFVGVFQVAGAWMLLWNRSKLIGTAILLPIMLNIVVFDAIYGIPVGALVSACVYLTLLFFILVLNREKVMELLAIATRNSVSIYYSALDKLKIAGIVIAILFVLFELEHFLMVLCGH
jgi:hypothetical protein